MSRQRVQGALRCFNKPGKMLCSIIREEVLAKRYRVKQVQEMCTCHTARIIRTRGSLSNIFERQEAKEVCSEPFCLSMEHLDFFTGSSLGNKYWGVTYRPEGATRILSAEMSATTDAASLLQRNLAAASKTAARCGSNGRRAILRPSSVSFPLLSCSKPRIQFL
jgi:hypothetical protein